MAIDTEITGSPGSIRSAATWLGGTLRPAVGRGGDALLGARRTAASEWRGDTGGAFVGAMGRAVTQVDRVEDGVREVRTCFDEYADVLERCQSRMAALREEARAAGLVVSGFTIQPPGAGPAHPGSAPTDAPLAQVEAYDADVAVYERHQELIRVYNSLVERVDEVWRDIEAAWQRVAEKDRALDGPTWTINLSSIAGGLAGAALDLHGSILRADARYFADLAAENLERLRTSPVSNAAQFYDDLDHYRATAASAADDAARASNALRIGKALPLAAGGALTGVGIWYDMEHGGESAGQAVTSNVGGFAASVATGAVVGTAIGGPVGTVAGVIVGAGVGVFTSGMIDGLWASGGDVGEAFMAGVDTLADTGGALVEGAGDVGGAIVDGIGGIFD